MFYVLGVCPEEFGLVPDPEGFISLKELFQALREEQEWRFLGQGHLTELLHAGFREDLEIVGDRIRWRTPKRDFTPRPVTEPPQRLYCGIRPRAHAVVMEKGLKPFKGSWVVLSRTQELAMRIGRRRDPNPVIIQIKAQEASKGNMVFFAIQGDLFLVEQVPPEFLEGPPVTQKERHVPKPPPFKAPGPPTPGSFFLDLPKDMTSGKNASQRRKRDPHWKRERKKANKG